MKTLGKKESNVSKAEPRSLLPSGTDVARGSALECENEPASELLINELAQLIVEAYFYHKNNGN